MRRAPLWFLLLAAFIAAVVLVRVRYGAELEPVILLGRLRSLGDSPWAVVGFVLGYLAGTALLVPSVVFHVVSGAAWGFPRAALVNLVMANVASNLQFQVGRALGQARLGPWLSRRGWTRVHGGFQHTGAFTMVMVRQLPLPFLAVNLLAGTTPMPWWQFALGSGLGLVPQVLVSTWFAAAIADGVEGARERAFAQALMAGAAMIAVGLGSRWLTAWWTRREAR